MVQADLACMVSRVVEASGSVSLQGTGAECSLSICLKKRQELVCPSQRESLSSIF